MREEQRESVMGETVELLGQCSDAQLLGVREALRGVVTYSLHPPRPQLRLVLPDRREQDAERIDGLNAGREAMSAGQ